MSQVNFQHIDLDSFPLPDVSPSRHLLVMRPARRSTSKFAPIDRVYVIDGGSAQTLDYAYGFDLVSTGEFHFGCPIYRVVLVGEGAQHHVSNVLEVVPV